MTQRQFNVNIRRLLRNFQKRILSNPELEKKLRAELREEKGLIYVREYTVAARFRQYRPKEKVSKKMERTYAWYADALH